MNEVSISDILNSNKIVDKKVSISGWVRTFRANRFIALNDGSTIKNIQVVAEGSFFSEELLKKITTGSCIHVEGQLVSSKGKGQSAEILAAKFKANAASEVLS